MRRRSRGLGTVMAGTSLVWYVSYGSNLSSERFRVYLEGGRAPGRATAQAGARDRSLWSADRSVHLDRRLFFAGWSGGWGGGVAHVDPAPGSADPTVAGPTLARAYLVTVEQFQDVLAQESGRPVGTEVDLAPALASGQAVVGEGTYDRVLAIGTLEGRPMLTFTTPRAPRELTPNRPSVAYLATIVAGLVESHGLTEPEARDHLQPAVRAAGGTAASGPRTHGRPVP